MIPLWWGRKMRVPVPALKINHSIVGKQTFSVWWSSGNSAMVGGVAFFNNKKRYNTFSYITKNTQYVGNNNKHHSGNSF